MDLQTEQNINCEFCGGTNFYQEMGLYYCGDCHTQTQEVKEFAVEVETDQPLMEDKIKIKVKKSKEADICKLTSWECYNYLIKGLCSELVKLGAGNSLEVIVKKLWFKYLLKVEVINSSRPKLQAVNSKVDAEIIYGKKRRRKRKSRASSSKSELSEDEISMMDERSLRRERSKTQKKLVEAHYDYSMLSQGDMNTSLANETLESLKTSSRSSSETSIPIAYNKYAEEELKKCVTPNHLIEHSEDFENELKCHPTSYRARTNSYRNSAHVLSINKVYALIYIGLLISKSKVQLSDMLRFIREGHLSYNDFKHFFPDDVNYNFLTRVRPKNCCLTSWNVRHTAYYLAEFLELQEFVQVQNLVDLSEKFCKELCLPDDIKKRVLQLISVSQPRLIMRKNSTMTVPNYEGRILSLILFQLKMLFGLDGKTEKELSKLADTINNKSSGKMFNFSKWLQFINYRHMLIQEFNFPSSFKSDKDIKNPGFFLNFILEKFPEFDQTDPSRSKQKRLEDCMALLSKIKTISQRNLDELLYFKPSFTPYKDYMDIIFSGNRCNTIQSKILSQNFDNTSIEYLTNPIKHLSSLFEGSIKFQHCGCNKNIFMHRLKNPKHEAANDLKKNLALKMVKIKKHVEEKCEDNFQNTSEDINVSDYMEDFNETHESSFTLRENISKITYGKESYVHYLPHECYWINTNFNFIYYNKKEFNKYYKSFPYAFRKVFEEFVRISEQSVRELLYEFNQTELYLLYVQKFSSAENLNLENVFHDNTMKILIRNAANNW